MCLYRLSVIFNVCCCRAVGEPLLLRFVDVAGLLLFLIFYSRSFDRFRIICITIAIRIVQFDVLPCWGLTHTSQTQLSPID